MESTAFHPLASPPGTAMETVQPAHAQVARCRAIRYTGTRTRSTVRRSFRGSCAGWHGPTFWTKFPLTRFREDRNQRSSSSLAKSYLLLIAQGVPPGVQLLNKNSGTTSTGAPFLRVFLPNGVLLPGQSTVQTLRFKRPDASQPIRYQRTLLSGQGKPVTEVDTHTNISRGARWPREFCRQKQDRPNLDHSCAKGAVLQRRSRLK